MRQHRLLPGLFAVAMTLLLGGALASTALADTIGGPDSKCKTCQGASYTLFYSGSPISTTATTTTYQVTLEIDTSTYTGGGVKLDTVAVKVSSDLTSALLVAAPGGVANWTSVPGGLDANGCSGSGSGFECAMANSLAVAPSVGGLLTWTWNLEVPNNKGLGGASIKARYVNSDGEKVGDLVSEDITLQTRPPQNIPEPATLLLVGSGLVALARRRLR